MSLVPVPGWYTSLVDDCRAILTEAVFNSRWELIVGYHQLGKRIVTDGNFQRFSKGNKDACNSVARNLSLSGRTLYYAMKFYEMYPDLDLLPGGKNISWHKITNELLPGNGEEKHVPVWDTSRSRLHSYLMNFMADVQDLPESVRALLNRLLKELQ